MWPVTKTQFLYDVLASGQGGRVLELCLKSNNLSFSRLNERKYFCLPPQSNKMY